MDNTCGKAGTVSLWEIGLGYGWKGYVIVIVCSDLVCCHEREVRVLICLRINICHKREVRVLL